MESENVVAPLSQRMGGNARDDEWTPITGWPLKLFGELAETADCPDFLLKALRTRPLWRQAVNIALATNALDDPTMFLHRGLALAAPNDPLKALARLLPAMTPHQVLRGAFDRVPVGLISILGRLGTAPLRPDSYTQLVEWLGERAPEPLRTRWLQQHPALEQTHIDIAKILHPAFLQQKIHTHPRTVNAAQRLNDALDLIVQVCASADHDGLVRSAQQLGGRTLATAFIQRWLRKADQLGPAPFEDQPDLIVVRTIPQLLDLGRRFSNCIGNQYLTAVLTGRVTFVECPDTRALVLLRRLSGGKWLLASVHVPGNGVVPHDLEQAIRSRFAAYPSILEFVAPAPLLEAVTQDMLGWGLHGCEPLDLEQWD